MICKIDDMKDKQVVCVKNGNVVGTVSDFEIDTETGTVSSLIIYGRQHFLGILGRENDVTIPWQDIEVIGSETILVNTDPLR